MTKTFHSEADRTRLTHLSVHGGADEQLSVVLHEDWTHVEYDPVVVLTLWRRPEQSPPLLPGPGQVPHHQLTTGHTHTEMYIQINRAYLQITG